MSRKPIAIALLIAALALVSAGCGSSNDSGTSGGGYGAGAAAKPTTTSPAESGGAVVAVAAVPKLGKVIVDEGGLTLYDFHKDKGTVSSCYGQCAAVWPPLTTEGSPQGKGVAASKLGTTKRKDGTTQVTFAGHPLYTYAADSKPGEANGNDFSSFGAQWYALEPSGAELEG
jgi:predicted lipoprotein with Yx(FWY)xxD motif